MTDAPTGSNADEWALFLSEWGTAYCAVRIAEAIESAEQRGYARGIKEAVKKVQELATAIPDDEPRQIVCTGEEPGDDVWQPAFGTWEADDFGLDSDEPVSRGERLFVNRRLFDALFAKCDALEAENQRLREAGQAIVDRWDTPWKYAEATAHVINQVRAALKGDKS